MQCFHQFGNFWIYIHQDVNEFTNMVTHHKHGYPYNSDQRIDVSLEHIAKNIWNIYNHIQRVSPFFCSASDKTSSNCNFCTSLFPENSIGLHWSHFSTWSRCLSTDATNKSRNLDCQKSPLLPLLSKTLCRIDLRWH